MASQLNSKHGADNCSRPNILPNTNRRTSTTKILKTAVHEIVQDILLDRADGRNEKPAETDRSYIFIDQLVHKRSEIETPEKVTSKRYREGSLQKRDQKIKKDNTKENKRVTIDSATAFSNMEAFKKASAKRARVKQSNKTPIVSNLNDDDVLNPINVSFDATRRPRKRESVINSIVNVGVNGNGEDQVMSNNPNEPTYCLCDQVFYGEMIGCDNPDCPIEWFHFECVKITTKPKGQWFCPWCKKISMCIQYSI